jgi:hypothetical protein
LDSLTTRGSLDVWFVARNGTQLRKEIIMNTDELKRNVVIDSGANNYLWIFTIIGSVGGGLLAILGILKFVAGQPNGELVGGSMAAMGVACAVIPYCLARAVSEMGKSGG